MNAQEIIDQISKSEYKPIYFLCGDEPYYIDLITDYIEEHVLTEQEKAFNQLVLYGKETNYSQIVDNARQFPMIAERRVLIIKEAQEFSELERLENYIKNPSLQTILVLAYKYKKLDGRKAISKLIKDKTLYFESNQVRDYQLPAWIKEHIGSLGYGLDPGVAELLAEYMGNDLSKIQNEITKLTLGLEAGESIGMKLVEQKIGISKEYNIFELQKALASKDRLKSYRILNYLSANIKKNPLHVLLGALQSYFSKVLIARYYSSLPDQALFKKLAIPNAYFVREYRMAAGNYTTSQIKKILHLLKTMDGRSKGINNRSEPEEALLQELVFQILHG